MNFSKCHRNDWVCKSCNTVVYGNNINTLLICICGQTRWGSKTYKKGEYTWRIGDKLCNNWNFKSNTNCKYCKKCLDL